MEAILNRAEYISKKFLQLLKRKRNYFIIYSIIFIIICLAVFSFFYMNGKTFIWVESGKDGIAQHYNCFVYYSHYLKTFFYNLFVNHTFSLPTWDFSIGYGADILTTMSFITIGDVLNFFSVLVPHKFLPYFFVFISILRLYLAGLAFSAFCFKMKKDHLSILVGVFVYLFAGYVIFALPRHPFFINSMIYLPLVLLGAEKILRKEKPYIFIFSVAYTLAGNFYFFFMIFIMLTLYVILRYFSIYKEQHLKNIIYFLKKFISNGLIGVLIACFMFLPILMRFFSDSRVGGDVWVPLFYNQAFYEKFFASFVMWQSPGYWTYLSFGPTALIAIFTLFMQKKEYRYLKYGFIILTLLLLFPYAGQFLNGFSYISNRWVFAYVFLMSFMVVCCFPLLAKLNKKQLILLIFGNLLYALICLFYFQFEEYKLYYAFIPLLLIVILIVLINTKKLKKWSHFSLMCIQSGCLVIVLLNAVVNAYSFYSPEQGNYVEEFLEIGKENSTLKKATSQGVLYLDDKSFFRYSDSVVGKENFANSNLNSGIGSPNYFFSFSNPNSRSFYDDLDIGDGNVLFLDSLDSRAILNTISSIKYYVVSKGQDYAVPYGFEKIDNNSQSKYTTYENQAFLPIGYTYENILPYSQFEKLNYLQKQEALIQNIVVPDHTLNEIPQKDVSFNSELNSVKFIPAENVEVKSNKIIVKKKGEKVKLVFDNVSHSEMYLHVENLNFTPINPSEYQNIKDDKTNWSAPTQSTITIESDIKKKIKLRTPQESYYNPLKKNYSVNMGYSTKERNNIELTFQQAGEYSFDALNVGTLNMDEYYNRISMLKKEVLEDVVISTNKVEGTINVENQKVLCLSIPYTNGWKAYIDDVETEIVPGNIMYMALPLSPGKHKIVLTYETPGLKGGIILSTLGIISLLVPIVYRKHQRKKTGIK